MNSNPAHTYPNLIQSIPLAETENGLKKMNEDNVTDEVVTDTESVDTNNKPNQYDINNIANDALFDGNGYSKGNPNGVAKEYNEVNTKVEVLVDDSKIDNLLPIEKINQSKDLSTLNNAEKELRDILLEDLEKAQFATVVALYHYVKVGKQLLNIKQKRLNKPKSLIRIIESVGLNERTAFRYMKIAKDERFGKMTESQFKSLHHLTQSKMITMTKFKDEKFYEAINDEDFTFHKKKKVIEMGSDIKFDKDLYETFKSESKDYIINEYNSLYIKYMELKNTIDNQCNKEVA